MSSVNVTAHRRWQKYRGAARPVGEQGAALSVRALGHTLRLCSRQGRPGGRPGGRVWRQGRRFRHDPAGVDRADQSQRLRALAAVLGALGLIFLGLFQGTHRIRGLIRDLGVHGGGGIVATLCYGGAIAGSVWAVAVVI